MAKFLNYEDWLEIQNGLNEHLTFTQIGEKLSRDRTTITKEKRYAGQMAVSIPWLRPVSSVNLSATVTVSSLRRKYVHTVLNRRMSATDAAK